MKDSGAKAHTRTAMRTNMCARGTRWITADLLSRSRRRSAGNCPDVVTKSTRTVRSIAAQLSESRRSSKTKRSPEGARSAVEHALNGRRRTRPQARSDFNRLSRQHVNAVHVSLVARVTDAHGIHTLPHVLRR